MKKQLRVIMILMIGINLVGCGSQRDKATRVMLQTLEDRYEEEFVIDSMGNSWGTFDDSTIKAWVHPTDNPDNIFKAQIKKDFSRVDDDYMNILMTNKITDELRSILKPVYGDKFELFVSLYSDMTDTGFKEMDIETFFKTETYANFIVDVYIRCEDIPDKEVELQRLKDIAVAYEDRLEVDTTLYLYYLKAPIFDEVDTKREELDNDYQYYSNEDQSHNYAEIDFPLQTEDLTLELFRD